MAFLVRPTTKGFRVLEESYNPHKITTVPKMAYTALGFRVDMSLAEAKARAKQLNGQSGVQSKRIANTARRVDLIATENSLYLPAADTARFEQELADIYADDSYRLEINL